MPPIKAALAALSLAAAVAAMAGCSAGMNRQLVSISISPPSGSGAPVTYVATGTFTGAPVTVKPLSVSWYLMGPAIDPPGSTYSLTRADYIATRCELANPLAGGTFTVIAVAPADPNAPRSGSMSAKVFQDLVIAHTASSEDGFVAGTAKLSCH